MRIRRSDLGGEKAFKMSLLFLLNDLGFNGSSPIKA